MVRSPSCLTKTTDLKKGSWTSDEDEILTKHIKLHGHPNWRALPRLAGLARCGKSCRLRWTNYLHPGIKRGNFTKEEEDIIITSHQLLGNRWSAIAAKLTGRTDNEIKNVWHTHLKKKLLLNQDDNIEQSSSLTDESRNNMMSNEEKDFILIDESIFDRVWDDPNVNQVQQTTNMDDLDHDQSDKTLINGPSTCITTTNNNNNNNTDYLPYNILQRSYSETSYNNYNDNVPSPEEFDPEMDESFLYNVLSSDHEHNNSGSCSMESYYPCNDQQQVNNVINMETDRSQNVGTNQVGNVASEYNTIENGGDVDDFWFDVLFKAGEHIMFS